MWDPLAPNPILQGDPEANRRFAGALGAVAAPDQAQAAPVDAAAIARALREGK